MKSVALFSILFLSTWMVQAQTVGFYGKTKFVDINTTGYIPMLYWIGNGDKNIVADGNTLRYQKDKFNYGFIVNAGFAKKRNLAFSLELGYFIGNFSAPQYVTYTTTDQWGYTYEDYVDIQHEMLKIQTLSIMPKIEFSQYGGLLPVGLNHQIGLGYTMTHIADKQYTFRILNNVNDLTTEQKANLSKDLFDYDQSFGGFTFLYAFNIRTPITKTFMINYGIRYTLNLRNYFQVSPLATNKYFDNEEAHQFIGRALGRNFITFNIGLTYSF